MAGMRSVPCACSMLTSAPVPSGVIWQEKSVTCWKTETKVRYSGSMSIA